MDSKTGDLYKSVSDAVDAGVPREDIIELLGTEKAIRRLSRRAKKGTPKGIRDRRERQRRLRQRRQAR